MVALSAAQGYAQVCGKPAAVIVHVVSTLLCSADPAKAHPFALTGLRNSGEFISSGSTVLYAANSWTLTGSCWSRTQRLNLPHPRSHLRWSKPTAPLHRIAEAAADHPPRFRKHRLPPSPTAMSSLDRGTSSSTTCRMPSTSLRSFAST